MMLSRRASGNGSRARACHDLLMTARDQGSGTRLARTARRVRRGPSLAIAGAVAALSVTLACASARDNTAGEVAPRPALREVHETANSCHGESRDGLVLRDPEAWRRWWEESTCESGAALPSIGLGLRIRWPAGGGHRRFDMTDPIPDVATKLRELRSDDDPVAAASREVLPYKRRVLDALGALRASERGPFPMSPGAGRRPGRHEPPAPSGRPCGEAPRPLSSRPGAPGPDGGGGGCRHPAWPG